jgi:Acyl-coenzyme A:6-aminopenicillanic acid acyl-transferase
MQERGIMKHEWRESNGQPYLYVEAGDHYDLGVGQGKGMVKQILASKKMSRFLPLLVKTTPRAFKATAREYLPLIPEKYQDELRGMADGASEASGKMVSFDDILVQALSLEVLYGRYNFNPANLPNLKKLQACTCFAAVNQDGSVVMGQNYDAAASTVDSMCWVLHKLEGEPMVFSARLGGVPAMPVGKNEFGLAMVVNVIITNVTAPVMTPRFVRTREAFATCKTAQEAYKIMYVNDEFPFSLNMLISDTQKVVGVQIMPGEVRSNYVKDTLVQANKYDYVDWQQYLRDPDYSLERYARAEDSLRRAYQNDSHVSNEMLLDIMRDSPIICRDDAKESGLTVAFMTRESFGLGNARGNVGKIPI